jgi:ribonuclease P protein component
MLARVNHRPYARLGLGVPKRQIRRATARNRIKRLIRESFRHDQLKLTGLDIVVLVRGGAVGADNLHILAALSEQWDKLRQQCEISS